MRAEFICVKNRYVMTGYSPPPAENKVELLEEMLNLRGFAAGHLNFNISNEQYKKS